MSTSVILIGDTHLPRFGRVLPAPLVQALETTDLILHAGDITEPFVLDLLAAHAPVEAVAGNNDGPHLARRLGHTRVVIVEEARIGLTHGHLGAGRTTPERARLTFKGSVDAIAFGHSHRPMIERIDGIWLLNPGSPTDRRREPSFSFIRLEVAGKRIDAELVRYAWHRGIAHASPRHMTDQIPRDRDDWTPDGETAEEVAGENRPRPSPADGGDSEGGERPPRPSQAEGERDA